MSLDSGFMYKLVVIGDTNCGKTNIVTRYAKNEFDDISRPTIGVEFYQRDLQVLSLQGTTDEVRVKIWDTAGQERFRGMASSYYRKANGVLIVYDITNRNSFVNLEKWMEEVSSLSEENTEIVLVGNKKDLVADRQIRIEEAMEFANLHHIKFFETSAKDNRDHNIESMFNELVRLVHIKEKKRQLEMEQSSRQAIEKDNIRAPDLQTRVAIGGKKSSSCC